MVHSGKHVDAVERLVPFNRVTRVRGEEIAVTEALRSGHLTGNGPQTGAAQERLRSMTGAATVLLTTSGTAALEMACILIDLKPGDEVIVPSYTFSSCANAIALRGAVPVFVDVREDTFNIDESVIERAITDRTRAIMPVHYAGTGAAMDEILALGERYGLRVIEDAAQAVGARYRGRPLGSLGHLGAMSFHGSKNLSCGEGGALLVNDPVLAERAEVVWEKGTNRSRFLRGEVDKYTWVDIGSSFLPSEITAALLLRQLEEAQSITERRRVRWLRYHERLGPLEAVGRIRRPVIPEGCYGNGHIYAVLLSSTKRRDAALFALARRGVMATFHYVPLHAAPAGLRFGRAASALPVTEDIAERLIRLPIYDALSVEDQDHVIENFLAVVGGEDQAWRST